MTKEETSPPPNNHLQQQQPVPGMGLQSEAEYACSLPEGMARHERSASGQEQGLAMAEQVINAYKLGLKISEALDKDTGIPGTCLQASVRSKPIQPSIYPLHHSDAWGRPFPVHVQTPVHSQSLLACHLFS